MLLYLNYLVSKSKLNHIFVIANKKLMSFLSLKMNFRTNLLSKENCFDNNINNEAKNVKHFFNYVYHIYKSNNQQKRNETAIDNFKKFKSFFKHPKSGILSSQSQKEIMTNARILLKSKQNRSESAKVIYSNNKLTTGPLLKHTMSHRKNSKGSLKTSRNNKVILQIEKQNKGDIPFLLPATVTYMNNYNSFSEKNRHERLIELYNKLIFFNETKPDKANEYLKEFSIKNGISNDTMLTEDKMNNLKEFILNNSTSVNPSRSIRDILIEGLNYSIIIKENDAKKDNCFQMYLSRNIIDKSQKIKSNMRNNSLSTAKIDLFKYMNMNKQKKIVKDNELMMMHNNSKGTCNYSKINLINELENDINAALKKRENKFKEMNRMLMNSFSFLTLNLHNNNDINSNKTKENQRSLVKKQVKPFMLTISRTKSKSNFNININNNNVHSNFNRSVYMQRNKKDFIPNHKLQRAYSTNQINHRLYYSHVNKDQTVNKIKSIKKAMKLTEYILYKQTKNRQSIENAMKMLDISNSIY